MELNPYKLPDGMSVKSTYTEDCGHTLILGTTASGMSCFADYIAVEQVEAGGVATLSDNGQSANAVMRVGRKFNAGVAVEPKVAPYYRQFDKRKF